MANSTNERTIVATFRDYAKARQAVTELEANGIPSGDIHMDASRNSAGTGDYGERQETHEGGFVGWWKSLFGGDDDTERSQYEGALAGGNTIVRVQAPEYQLDQVTDILNRLGAEDVDKLSSREGMRTDFARQTATDTRTDRPIEVVEEELQVGKRAVRRGGVRIYSHVVSQPVEEQVRLREEHVTVERRRVNRELSPDQVGELRDQTIEVVETAEEPVVAKRARVTEEVVVGKQATDRTETIRDTVRRTEVDVEHLEHEGVPVGGGMRGAETASAGERRSGGVRATGLLPNEPSPSVQFGGGSTAGAGTLAGETTAGWNSSQDLSSGYRKHFESMFEPGEDFESVRPAYEYGSRYAGDPRYKGMSWDQAESQLRSGYERDYPGQTWDRVKSAVRHGWERVTGQR